MGRWRPTGSVGRLGVSAARGTLRRRNISTMHWCATGNSVIPALRSNIVSAGWNWRGKSAATTIMFTTCTPWAPRNAYWATCSVLANCWARPWPWAWEQEEATNKPVVLYYIARLFYEEYRVEPETTKLFDVGRLLLFMHHYPATWQTFRDRAERLLADIEADTEQGVFDALKQQSSDDLVESVLGSIATLMH
jgi:hypothetical protein